MKRTWIGIVLLGLIVGGVVAAKAMRSDSSTAALSAASDARANSAASPQVLLFADPAEAEESCGCGQIFQAVREASTRGVRTREVDPERELDAVRQYRVTVEPTVLFVDSGGQELKRWEGESEEVIRELQAQLDELAGAAG